MINPIPFAAIPRVAQLASVSINLGSNMRVIPIAQQIAPMIMALLYFVFEFMTKAS